MKAVILASGAATRLRPLTDNVPKCLVEVNGEPILGRMLKSLESHGIEDVLITTGHLGRMIEEYVSRNFPHLNVEYVTNPKFSETNYIYSLWLAKDRLDSDIILMHGDLVYDWGILGKLLKGKRSIVPINNTVPPPKKDFKGLVKDGKVIRVGVKVFGEGAFFLAPMYRLSKEDLASWMEEISKFVERGEVKCYAEDAFNMVSHKMDIRPLYYGEELCMEVDDHSDLEIANKVLSK